ncbi:MAG: DUF1622 domain-containing protein [Chloroflexi bacterium]|nr:DUF1622 domain-containing protein [Chloroflexota bacterium]
MDIDSLIEAVGRLMDVAGVAVMVIGAIVVTFTAVASVARNDDLLGIYRRYRGGLGRSILLGLELLVAADIIRTVAVAPTIETVGVLGLIVLIRTLLSFSLEIEVEGRLPWRQRPARDGVVETGA